MGRQLIIVVVPLIIYVCYSLWQRSGALSREFTHALTDFAVLGAVLKLLISAGGDIHAKDNQVSFQWKNPDLLSGILISY